MAGHVSWILGRTFPDFCLANWTSIPSHKLVLVPSNQHTWENDLFWDASGQCQHYALYSSVYSVLYVLQCVWFSFCRCGSHLRMQSSLIILPRSARVAFEIGKTSRVVIWRRGNPDGTWSQLSGVILPRWTQKMIEEVRLQNIRGLKMRKKQGRPRIWSIGKRTCRVQILQKNILLHITSKATKNRNLRILAIINAHWNCEHYLQPLTPALFEDMWLLSTFCV